MMTTLPRFTQRSVGQGFILALLALAQVCCSSSPPSKPTAAPRSSPELQLLFTGDLHGVTEPCGCTADLVLGGLDRLAGVNARIKASAPESTLVVDTGDLLAADSALHPGRVPQERARADVIADAARHMGYVAVAVGERDLALGLEGLRRAADRGGFQWLAANLAAPAAPWKPWIVVERQGIRVGLVGVLEPELLALEGVSAEPVAESLDKAIVGARAAGAQLIVVLGHLSRRKANRLARKIEGVDLWLRGHDPRRSDAARQVSGSVLLEPHEEGQSLGRVRILLRETADSGLGLTARGLSPHQKEAHLRRKAHLERTLRSGAPEELVASARAELGDIESSLRLPATTTIRPERPGDLVFTLVSVTPEEQAHPDVAALRTGFNRSLKKLNLANPIPPPPLPSGAPGFAGAEECGMCHGDEEEQWMTTRHSRAMATLIKREKDFDEECVSCHVTGYRRPGGSALGFLGNLVNVQCEACHGPSQPHAEDGSEATAPSPLVGPEVCTGCHNKKHSPNFDYAEWKRRLLGPGHGMPLVTEPPPASQSGG